MGQANHPVSTANLPDAMIVTLFPKAGSNRCALLLDNGSFVSDSFGCADVPDELFY